MAYFCDNPECQLHREVTDDILKRSYRYHDVFGNLRESRRNRHVIRFRKSVLIEDWEYLDVFLCDSCTNLEKMIAKMKEAAEQMLELDREKAGRVLA